MTDQLTKALTLSCIVVIGLLLWALSIAFVLRDVNRRQLPGYEQAAWLVLAALLPLIGGGAYLFARLLDRTFSPRASRPAGLEERVTAEKPPTGEAVHLPTIAAADLVRKPGAEVQAGQARMSAPEARPEQAYLEFISGPLAGRRFDIERLPLRIGRGPLVALSLDEDLGVSRHHAEIYESDGQLRIRDLQSAHGTSLNGKNITDDRLNPGDHLSLGQSTLVFKRQGGHGRA